MKLITFSKEIKSVKETLQIYLQMTPIHNSNLAEDKLLFAHYFDLFVKGGSRPTIREHQPTNTIVFPESPTLLLFERFISIYLIKEADNKTCCYYAIPLVGNEKLSTVTWTDSYVKIYKSLPGIDDSFTLE
jgi:hypothetical protein